MPTPNEFVEKVLKIALEQVGQMEVPRASNRGKMIDQYLASTNNPPGVPYCASFNYWCIREAGRFFKIPEAKLPYIKTGWCPTIDSWAKENKVRYDVPQRGDVFLVYQHGRMRHTGLVLETYVGSEGPRFRTIEGNTNPDGSAEGIGVFKRSRPQTSTYKYVRYKEIMQEDQQAKPKLVDLYIDDDKFLTMEVLRGTSWCPIRKWANRFNMFIDFDRDSQTVILNGRPMISEISAKQVEGGIETFAPIRDLATLAGLIVDDSQFTKGKVIVRKPKDQPAPSR